MTRSVVPDDVLRGIANWDELKAKLQLMKESDVGRVFERLVQLFLSVSPVYQVLLRHVWLREEVEPKLAKRLNLPANDQGIDLVAETFEGEYWAIQCKYCDDESASVTWSELSTFVGLTFGVCKNFSFGLICTSTEHIAKLLQAQSNIGFCSIDTWRHLDDEFFSTIRGLLKNKRQSPIAYRPRPHQERAVSRGIEHFHNNDKARGRLISPCGSGKSLTAFWLSLALKSNLTLVSVPSLALIKQTLRVWAREFTARGEQVRFICVCSDESAGRVELDELVLFTHDLGVPCVTDIEYLTNWLMKRSEKSVVLTTYQSGETIATASRKAGVAFDFAVMDEAHKTTGRHDRLFSHLLFDKNIEIKRRLFMTATERHYVGESDQVVGMEDEALYGEAFEVLTFTEALRANPPILCDYRIITVEVSGKEVRQLIERNAYVRPDLGNWPDMTAEQFAGLIALRKAIRRYKIDHAVSFHNSIAKAEKFAAKQQVLSAVMPDFGVLETLHVSGKMSTARRDRLLKSFASVKPSLVTNARCLTEGVDVPEIDCVFFADPRQSTIDIVQAAGRAMRRSEGKETGYIVIPLFLEEDATINDLFDGAPFRGVLTVLRALAANDERIIEYFRDQAAEKPRSDGPLIDFEVSEVLPKNVSAKTFIDAIELQCWGKLAKLSWRPFAEAREFVHSLGLQSEKEWREYIRSNQKPPDIPASVALVYKGQGWISMGDWLGTGRIADSAREYREFASAREYVHTLSLSSESEWRIYCKSGAKPDDIPSKPYRSYKDSGWISMGDWLGTGRVADQLKQYRNFDDAVIFVRQLGLRSEKEWREFTKSGAKPDDIPANPNAVYKNKGWQSMGHWLGTGRIADQLRTYRPFEEAREFVRGLGLKTQHEWSLYCKSGEKPNDIPGKPEFAYAKSGWTGLGDWLGTGFIPYRLRGYPEFEVAREHARSLGFTSRKQWTAYVRSGVAPIALPLAPEMKYGKSGWAGWADFLGNSRAEYRTFEDAREFVRSLFLNSGKEWKTYCQSGDRPDDIPASPWNTYRNEGWAGMGDWLGTGTIAPYLRTYKSFNEARAFVRSLGLKTQEKWEQFARSKARPQDIPRTPRVTYEGDWISMGDWLGTGRVANFNRVYREFTEARRFVQELRLGSTVDWKDYCKSGKKPVDIPGSPWQTYRDAGWLHMDDWLGTGRTPAHHRQYQSFGDARAFARGLGLQTWDDWRDYAKSREKPADIPASPHIFYKSQWQGMQDWLGYYGTRKGKPKKLWRDFQSAREFARSLRLKSTVEWSRYCQSGRKPDDIPVVPALTYKGDWVSFGDWLGTGRVADQNRSYRPFSEAREFVRTLRLKSSAEWRKYCQSGKKPDDIPGKPHQTYSNRGWTNLGDWLGTGRVADRERTYRPFKEARDFARKLNLKSVAEWRKYSASGARPSDIPLKPHEKYEEWNNWFDWLGIDRTKSIASRYLPFEEAKAFARTCNCNSTADWEDFCRSGKKPANIPAEPWRIYKEAGFISMADWLGSKKEQVKFMPFVEARSFVRSLGLTSRADWYAYCKSKEKPVVLPTKPNQVYRDCGWQDFRDWLGVETGAARFRSFSNARKFVHNLRVNSETEWRHYCKSGKKPDDIPAKPDRIYKDAGWCGYGDWLGSGRVASQHWSYRTFEKARRFVHSLNLKSEGAWREYCKSGKKPADIPAKPDRTYSEYWQGMRDWLGEGGIVKTIDKYRSFEQARRFVRKIGLRNQAEWAMYCSSGRKPPDIPGKPERVYAGAGWVSLGDWLGTGAIANTRRSFLPFPSARRFARSLRLTSQYDWRSFCASGKRPTNIPSAPHLTYKSSGWRGYRDWLGY